ncbi:MAG: hypothetical protein PUB69_00615 [Desulfovibrionaceae bacterium]|nr:hypothetical protein [Desulfovibrionaceae bacterium]
MRTIGKYTIIFIISLMISMLSFWIESSYLVGFFADNAPLLAGAIFAIFSSTIPVLLSHIKAITEKHGFSFLSTIKSIKDSILELIILLLIIFIMSIFIKSSKIDNIHQCCCADTVGYIKMLLSTIQIAATIGMIEVVRDLLSALIMCMENE